VNDLLDLAKAQAGKVVVHPVEFEVDNLFGALRGMLRPLLLNESVSLVFDDVDGVPPLYTDESKVSQILRNFISNALKFTERGEVRVSARVLDDGDAIAFAVRDTGMGIAPEDHERIFQEFTQLDSPVQRRVKGTGLGLPLCRRLAELLGGTVTVESAPGDGSTFTAVVPVHYEPPLPIREWTVDADRIRVLVVEDRADMVMLYERYLTDAGYQPIIARTLREAREALVAASPHAVILDIVLRGEDSWEFLAELKRRPDTAELPVMVVSTVADERKALALGADVHLVKPVDRSALLDVLRDLTRPRALHRILVVDDEEISRYVLRQHLAGNERQVVEAAGGVEALQRVRADRPDVVCLDLGMPDLDGFEVLRRLKADPDTSAIPVVVVTARELTVGERSILDELAAGVLSKNTVSRESTLAMIAAVAGRGG
jgi:CheY-like chemotaxis protein/anti-sigma regulatory factor (Ser/Thr protein kinase)